MKHSSSSKGKLAPAGPVCDPQHINRGPGPTKLAGTAKGQLGKLTMHPNHKSKVTRAANIDKQSPGAYPTGMKGSNSKMDKSGRKAKLPSTNRSNAGQGGKSSPGGTYSGPKGMKGSPEQAEYVRGTASTMAAKAPTAYRAPKGTTKGGTGVKP